jgi:hypothetical protein
MFITAAPLLFLSLGASGQASAGKQSDSRRKADVDKEPVAILEIGAGTNWNIKGGAATFAPNLAAEITPIEGWLAAGATVPNGAAARSTDTTSARAQRRASGLSRSPATRGSSGEGPAAVWIRRGDGRINHTRDHGATDSGTRT